MITGDTIYLTRLDAANAETIRSWINDPETHRWMMGGHIPISSAEETAFIESTEAEVAARTAFRFEVHAADDGRLLGVCGIEHVNLVHRHGEVGLFIGSAAERGRGFGADILKTLMRFAFDTLGLHSLRIMVVDGNERAHALYTRVGFCVTGRDRESLYLDGAFRDLIALDMLETEYRELYPKSD